MPNPEPGMPANRMTGRFRVLPGTATCLFIASLAACAPGGAPGAIWIAAAGQWEDGSAIAAQQGLELAVEAVNRSGGINGRPLRVRYEDDGYGSDPGRIMQAAAALVADRRILAVIGHARSLSTATAAAQYRGRLPLVSPYVQLSNGLQSTWAVSLQIPDSVITVEAARVAAERGWSTAVVLADNSPLARAVAVDFERRFAGRVLRRHPIFTVRVMGDYLPEAEFVRLARPDLVVIVTTPQTAQELFASLDAVSTRPAVMALLGDMRGVPGADGAMMITPLPASGERVGSAPTLPDEYRRRFGTELIGEAAVAYDAVTVVAAALRTGAGTRADVADALANVAVEGVTGPIAFDALGRRRAARVHALRVEGQRMVRPR